MVERKYLIKRKGKILAREYTREKAKSRKKVLQKAGIKYLSVVKIK